MNPREFLELQERLARAELAASARRLRDDLGEASLIPEAARRHPLGTVAGALALGLIAGVAAPRGSARAARAARVGLAGAGAGLGLLRPVLAYLLRRYL